MRLDVGMYADDFKNINSCCWLLPFTPWF